MTIVMPVMMTLKLLKVVSETTRLKETLLKPLLIKELKSTLKVQEKSIDSKLFY